MTFLTLTPASSVQAELLGCHHFVMVSENFYIIGFITSYLLTPIKLLKKCF